MLPIYKEEILDEDSKENLVLAEDSSLTDVSQTSKLCPKCHCLFSIGPVYEYHTLKCSQNLQYKCEDCHEEFSIPILYRKHLVERVNCDACSQTFCGQSKLSAHLPDCPAAVFSICGKCRITFNNSQLREHEDSCSIFACELCPKRFVSSETLAMHCSSKHTRGCNYCYETFNSETDYLNHASSQHSFVCDNCSSSFTTSIKYIESKGNVRCVKCLSLTDMKILNKKLKIGKKKLSDSNDTTGTDKTLSLLSYISYPQPNPDPPAVQSNSTKDCDILTEISEKDNAVQPPISPQLDSSSRCPLCLKESHTLVNVKSHLMNCHALSIYMKKREALTRANGCTNIQVDIPDSDVDILTGGVILTSLSPDIKDENIIEDVELNNAFDPAVGEVTQVNEEKTWSNALEKYEQTVDSLFDAMSLKKHIIEDRYTCEICGKSFSTHRAYRRHMTGPHDMNFLFNAPTNYHCCSCRSTKSTLRDLSSHLYNRHEAVFKCDHCPLDFASKAEMKLHIISVHPDAPVHDCRLCSCKFPNREQLNRHLLWHFRDEILVCGICGKRIVGRKKFANHKGYHRNRGRESQVNLCPECGKSLSSRSGLRAHIRCVHRGGKEATALCPDCGLLTTSRLLPQHRERVHGAGGLFHCQICSTSFLAKESLRQHLDTHIGGRPHRCDLCPSAFKQLRNLRMHKRNRHSGLPVPNRPRPAAKRRPRPLVECPVCSLSFPSRRMRAHAATHEPPKPHVSCGSCDKTFTSVGSLNSHIKWVHLGERNFPCSYCPARFKRRDAQKVHERRHTDERPFSCTMCDRLFRQRTDWKRHEAKHAIPGFRFDRRCFVPPLTLTAEITSGEDQQATAFLSCISKD